MATRGEVIKANFLIEFSGFLRVYLSKLKTRGNRFIANLRIMMGCVAAQNKIRLKRESVPPTHLAHVVIHCHSSVNNSEMVGQVCKRRKLHSYGH